MQYEKPKWGRTTAEQAVLDSLSCYCRMCSASLPRSTQNKGMSLFSESTQGLDQCSCNITKALASDGNSLSIITCIYSLWGQRWSEKTKLHITCIHFYFLPTHNEWNWMGGRACHLSPGRGGNERCAACLLSTFCPSLLHASASKIFVMKMNKWFSKKWGFERHASPPKVQHLFIYLSKLTPSQKSM